MEEIYDPAALEAAAQGLDAYDWVVETNVLGMSTYADGGLTATKPYVSGAAYINKMSNFCGH